MDIIDEENKNLKMKNPHLYTAISASLQAGIEIMKIYAEEFTVEMKEDKSPLTAADKKSNEIIMQFLSATSIPVISEENKQIPYEERKNWTQCWIVDPIDGTKEFIKKNGEFTVNIALVENSIPLLGVVYLPAQKTLYFAEQERGSFKYQLSENEEDNPPKFEDLIQKSQRLGGVEKPEKYTIVASRSHLSKATEDFINDTKKRYGEVEIVSKGSSIKLCLVAEGNANVYPRIAPTMEWDTAAAHAVAKYAGFNVNDFYEKTELKYNKENLLNPYFIVF